MELSKPMKILSSGTRLIAPVLVAAFGVTMFLGSLKAEDRVVPASELHASLVKAQEARDAKRKEVAEFFSSPQIRKALKGSSVEYKKIEKAVPMLSDEELGTLALRTQEIKHDLAAGALTNQQLTYIVIALVTAVVVILAT
jgi:hypothetical protein